MAKIYPIGVQNFAKLREDGYTYVDKTAFIDRLIKEGNCYFLSRPRRFGKSLLLSTIEAFYQGRKDLFDGLAISRTGHSWDAFPVFHIDFTGWLYDSSDSLIKNFKSMFRCWESSYGVEVSDQDNVAERFRNLISKAYEVTGRKVVILIDEYDKPLLDTAHDKELQDCYRKQLKAIYGNLKKMDAYIEFAMLTGVTKFGKLSIFSDLNNLEDISFSDNYSAICGITEEEIPEYFSEGVFEFARKNGISEEETYAILKNNYDGYHFSPSSPDIYNPYSLLRALKEGSLGSYWFSTGTPTFLVDKIRRMEIDLRELENVRMDVDELMDASFDLSNAIPVMYQSGYLTIRDYDPRFGTATLCYPNREVERGFLNGLMKIFTRSRSPRSEFDVSSFVLDVEAGRTDDFMTRLQALFSGYKYSQVDLGHLELHYRNVIYLVMKLMGFYTEAEMQTAAGRIDLMVRTPEYLYLFEFKLNRSAKEALEQINSRDYLLPFRADGRKIIKVGANFDDSIRSISTPWLVEHC